MSKETAKSKGVLEEPERSITFIRDAIFAVMPKTYGISFSDLLEQVEQKREVEKPHITLSTAKVVWQMHQEGLFEIDEKIVKPIDDFDGTVIQAAEKAVRTQTATASR